LPVLLVMAAALDTKRATKLKMRQLETAAAQEIQLRVLLIMDSHATLETKAVLNMPHATKQSPIWEFSMLGTSLALDEVHASILAPSPTTAACKTSTGKKEEILNERLLAKITLTLRLLHMTIQGYIKHESCNGEYACYYNGAEIGVNSCNARQACERSTAPIGDNVCNAYQICINNASPVPSATPAPNAPTKSPSKSAPTEVPTAAPTKKPTTAAPTNNPTQNPTNNPVTPLPTNSPTTKPTNNPTKTPTT
ncbi:hypothetical protein HJC23_003037, partial [Cyclotella cryptica]